MYIYLMKFKTMKYKLLHILAFNHAPKEQMCKTRNIVSVFPKLLVLNIIRAFQRSIHYPLPPAGFPKTYCHLWKGQLTRVFFAHRRH